MYMGRSRFLHFEVPESGGEDDQQRASGRADAAKRRLKSTSSRCVAELRCFGVSEIPRCMRCAAFYENQQLLDFPCLPTCMASTCLQLMLIEDSFPDPAEDDRGPPP